MLFWHSSLQMSTCLDQNLVLVSTLFSMHIGTFKSIILYLNRHNIIYSRFSVRFFTQFSKNNIKIELFANSRYRLAIWKKIFYILNIENFVLLIVDCITIIIFQFFLRYFTVVSRIENIIHTFITHFISIVLSFINVYDIEL